MKTFILACVWGRVSLSSVARGWTRPRNFFFLFEGKEKPRHNRVRLAFNSAHKNDLKKREKERERRNKKNYTDRAYIDAVRGKGQKKELNEEDFLRVGRRRRRRCAFEAIWSRGDFRMMSEHYVSKK